MSFHAINPMPWGIRCPVYNDPANMHLCISGSSVYLLIYLPYMVYFARYDRLFAFSDIFALGVLQLATARPVKISLCCRIIVRVESSNSITRPIYPPFLPSPSRWFILEIKDIRIVHPSRSVENSCFRRKLMHLSIVVGFLSSLVFHQCLLTIVSIRDDIANRFQFLVRSLLNRDRVNR